LAALNYEPLLANPVAVQLGLDEPLGPPGVLAQAVDAFGSEVPGGSNVLYMYLLDACEKAVWPRPAHVLGHKTLAMVKRYSHLVVDHKAKVNFVWIDAIKFGDHAKALNLHEPKWPAFVIQDLTTQLKYPYSQEQSLDADKIEEMVEAYITNTLKPELKSKPVPESQDGPVFDLVGKQFDEVVFDDSRDVFIEFYASWCDFLTLH